MRKLTGDGMSGYNKWLENQPGYHNLTWNRTLYTIGSAFKKQREVPWDGTFNMPIMPLTNSLHRDMKGHMTMG